MDKLFCKALVLIICTIGLATPGFAQTPVDRSSLAAKAAATNIKSADYEESVATGAPRSLIPNGVLSPSDSPRGSVHFTRASRRRKRRLAAH